MLLQVRRHSFVPAPPSINPYSLITTHSAIVPPQSDHGFLGSIRTIQSP